MQDVEVGKGKGGKVKLVEVGKHCTDSCMVIQTKANPLPRIRQPAR